MKHLTEVERMQRHEVIVRDSYRQQQQSIRDWVRMLTALGLEPKEIKDMLSSLQTDISFFLNEVDNGSHGR